MSIEKKSLISTLKPHGKANVAKEDFAEVGGSECWCEEPCQGMSRSDGGQRSKMAGQGSDSG